MRQGWVVRSVFALAVLTLAAVPSLAQENDAVVAILLPDYDRSEVSLTPIMEMYMPTVETLLKMVYGSKIEVRRSSDASVRLAEGLGAAHQKLRAQGYAIANQLRVVGTPDGGLAISLLVWTKNLETIEEFQVNTVGNVLEAKADLCDQAMLAIVTNLNKAFESGAEIFGDFIQMTFNKRSGSGAYEIWINGNKVGSDLKTARIVRGKYVVEIRQKRVFGDYVVFARDYSALREGEDVVIDFHLPDSVQEDIEYFYAQVSAVSRAVAGGNAAAVESEYARLFSILGDARTPQRIRDLRKVYQAQYDSWKRGGAALSSASASPAVVVPAPPPVKPKPKVENPLLMEARAITVMDMVGSDFQDPYFRAYGKLAFDGYKLKTGFLDSFDAWVKWEQYLRDETVTWPYDAIADFSAYAGGIRDWFSFNLRGRSHQKKADLFELNPKTYSNLYLGTPRTAIGRELFDGSEPRFDVGLVVETLDTPDSLPFDVSSLDSLPAIIKIPNAAAYQSGQDAALYFSTQISVSSKFAALGGYLGLAGPLGMYAYLVNPGWYPFLPETTTGTAELQRDKWFAQASLDSRELKFTLLATDFCASKDTVNVAWYGNLNLYLIEDFAFKFTAAGVLPTEELVFDESDSADYGIPLMTLGMTVNLDSILKMNAWLGTMDEWEFSATNKVATYVKILREWSDRNGTVKDQPMYLGMRMDTTVVENLASWVGLKYSFMPESTSSTSSSSASGYPRMFVYAGYEFFLDKGFSLGIDLDYRMYMGNSSLDDWMQVEAWATLKF